MKLGYARTSTVDQVAGFEAQIAALTALGCTRIYQEQVSSVGERPELAAALDYLREGDQLVVTKLDRLARSTRHLLDLVERVQAKGASLSIQNLGSLDPFNRLGQAHADRAGCHRHLRTGNDAGAAARGISAAKAAGKYQGRKPTARAKADDVLKLAAEGIEKTEIARRLAMHRASVYRILASAPGS